MGIIVGIDASRNRSGGAIAHVQGIIKEGNPANQGIAKVHLWAYRKLLDSLPDPPWLIKHSPDDLEGSLAAQICWQFHKLPLKARGLGCQILFSTDAASVCRFRPFVVMSQDMMSYEPGIMKNFGFTISRIRLLAILLIQNQAFKRADGVIFLTKYAGKVIQGSCGPLRCVAFIPHGIAEHFRGDIGFKVRPISYTFPVRCLYVSNAALHKHQWVVIRAIYELRKRGYNVLLDLVGGGAGRGQALLAQERKKCDPKGEFVRQSDFVENEQLPQILANADIFIFASSCENMPITLLEAMSAGLPIACSNRGPMPEVLKDGGVYFDPLNAMSIANAVEQLILDTNLRLKVSKKAKELSRQYSWSRCADETFRFISNTYWNNKR